jgi:hypothetical protein
MASSALIRLGGLAAIVGGLMWVVKGGAILLTGEQLMPGSAGAESR